MPFKKSILLIIIGFFPLLLFSGEKYWVVFRDKEGVKFNPYEYFDPRVVEKRQALGIPLVQYTDLPVKEHYCESITDYSEISFRSRWLNAVAVELDEHQIEEIRKLEFVGDVQKMQLYANAAGLYDEDQDTFISNGITRQIEIFGADIFKKAGIDGRGVRIAVFDGGFPFVDSLEIFRHLFEEKRIIDTYDFVNKKPFVYDFNSHGTSVLACIAGKLDGQEYGLAPGAEFLLARTEVNAEIFAEEEYWAAAMEWAEKNGADIINSSLGYTYHRYFPKQMDGKSVFVTRMANLAARKGLLVINAAGNDGDSEWEVISAPADADSVLTVGGISSKTGIHIDFSSFGPTYDGRMKPNVVAFGDVTTTGKKNMKTSYGTSFSTPLVSGFAACVMQLHPDWDNMKVFHEIQNSGHLYPYFDYAHGFGVPQADYFLGQKKGVDSSFRFRQEGEYLEIILKPGEEEPAADEIQESDRGFGDQYPYLYYHIADENTGKIRKYKVLKMDGSESYSIDAKEIRKGELVRAHYKGYTESFRF